MFHTFTCCCAYTFVIKKEAGPIIARLFNLFQTEANAKIELEKFRPRAGEPFEVSNIQFL